MSSKSRPNPNEPEPEQTQERPIRVAILGASGFGHYHAREFKKAGAEVSAILGSTPESARQTADRLEQEYGISPEPHHDLEKLLETDPDAVSVCTPNELHYDQVKRSLAAQKFVFCEKPLFWQKDISEGETTDMLSQLGELGAEGRLGLNACNAILMDELDRLNAVPKDPKEFEFRVFTNGPYQGKDIAVDLLPHALSLLLWIAPQGTLEELGYHFATHRAQFEFRWGDLRCRFDLREDPKGPKDLTIWIDGRGYRRIIDVVEGQFRIFLQEVKEDDAPLVQVHDPLEVMVADFVQGVKTSRPTRIDFDRSTEIQLLMTRMLSSPPRS